jgi:hypothetical protein
MRRLTHAIILAAFVFSCGGQWYVLQGIAWINMIRDYSQMVPLARAVSMTFSGQYPCPICKAIAEKKNSEQQKAFTFEKHEKNFPLPGIVAIAPPAAAEFSYPLWRCALTVRSDTPPAPPPRSIPI